MCNKHLLLLLDNFEQILEAAEFVGDLLEAASHLKVLVTSRSILQLYGEREFGVPTLDVGDPTKVSDLIMLARFPAIRQSQSASIPALTWATATLEWGNDIATPNITVPTPAP